MVAGEHQAGADIATSPLALAARHGQYVLVAGLVAGLCLPSLANVLRPLIGYIVAALLFLSVLSIEPRTLAGAFTDLPKIMATVLALQLAPPLAILGVAHLAQMQATPVVLALTLMASAPAIVGSPNICLLMGAKPDAAMRIVTVGTALMPLTILPVFWLSPQLGNPVDVAEAALKLLAVIALTAVAATITRRYILRRYSEDTQKTLEGMSVITLAIFVIGLMPAVSDVAIDRPLTLLFWLLVACAANLGVQIIVHASLENNMRRDDAIAISIIAGNRNIALFLVSLPPDVTAPVLVFIGCYQIPMYLTPLLMQKIYVQR